MRAEWDPERQVVLATQDEGMDEPSETGIARDENVETVWLDVVPDYPEDYIGEFDELLGPSIFTFDEENGVLRQSWPHSDFTPEAIRAAIRMRVYERLTVELRATDPLVIRLFETGDPLPEQVAVGRQQVRERADDLIAIVDSTPEDELVELDMQELLTQLVFPEMMYPWFKR